MQTDHEVAILEGVQDLTGYGPELSYLISPVQSKEDQN